VIEEKENDKMLGILKNKEYVFHMKKKPAEWAGLKSHELILLAGIFGNGVLPKVPLSSLQNQFYTNLPNIKNGIFDELMEPGYFQHRPDYVRSGFVAGGIVFGVTLFLLGNAISQRTGIALAPFFIAAIVSAAIIVGFGMVHAGAYCRGRQSPGGRARI
jgi:hypothetical protein